MFGMLHIFNLVVQDGIKQIYSAIVKIQDKVKYARSSPQQET